MTYKIVFSVKDIVKGYKGKFNKIHTNLKFKKSVDFTLCDPIYYFKSMSDKFKIKYSIHQYPYPAGYLVG